VADAVPLGRVSSRRASIEFEKLRAAPDVL